jgi:hypothetical protein
MQLLRPVISWFVLLFLLVGTGSAKLNEKPLSKATSDKNPSSAAIAMKTESMPERIDPVMFVEDLYSSDDRRRLIYFAGFARSADEAVKAGNGGVQAGLAVKVIVPIIVGVFFLSLCAYMAPNDEDADASG